MNTDNFDKKTADAINAFLADFSINLKTAKNSGALPDDIDPYALARMVLKITGENIHFQKQLDKELKNLRNFIQIFPGNPPLF